VSNSSSAITVTCIALNNTAGLIFIVLMLGYGLVEWPKDIWCAVFGENFTLAQKAHVQA
jgi:hypothetical protein